MRYATAVLGGVPSPGVVVVVAAVVVVVATIATMAVAGIGGLLRKGGECWEVAAS